MVVQPMSPMWELLQGLGGVDGELRQASSVRLGVLRHELHRSFEVVSRGR